MDENLQFFLWHDAADFTAGLVPFLEDGLEAGEPMMVAVVPEHATWLKDALGDRVDEVVFVDLRELGCNPARIIPAWQQFLTPTPTGADQSVASANRSGRAAGGGAAGVSVARGVTQRGRRPRHTVLADLPV
jgi:hypothetical protein